MWVLNRRGFIGASATLWTSQAPGLGVVELITKTKLSVCAVGTYHALDSPRFGFRGSGFLVGDGSVVATCWHVLPNAPATERAGPGGLAIQLTQADGSLQVHEAELIGSDRQHDLALLRLRARVGPALVLSTAAPQEGLEVVLMGFPIGGALGFRQVTHRGMVASVVASSIPTSNARHLSEGAAVRLRVGSFELLQLDATAYPGNSGGPLLDASTGLIVGVINMVLLKSNRESALSHPTGISYAVPVRYLSDLVARS